MDLAKQYATSANLADRIALHQRFSTNPYGLQRWIFDRLGLRGGMRVLEIACGAGNLWRENLDRIPGDVDFVLSDFSIGMVNTTRAIVPRAKFVTFALPSLPFDDASFDLVIANHMLYHVDDLQRGLAGIRRVLKKGGALFAATNGIDHLRELKDLMKKFGLEEHDVSASFTLENGEAQLRGAFARVERQDHVDSLHITDPDAVLRYIASISPRAAAVVGERGAEMRAAAPVQVSKSTGSFIARSD